MVKELMFKQQGALLNKLRVKCDLNQSALARKLGCTGQFIGRIEKGWCGLPADYINKVSQLLNVNKSEFIEVMVQDYHDRLKKIAGVGA